MINLTKLKKKMIVKNYKELCAILDEPILEGNAKQAQLKEWARYFKFHKQRKKQSIMIDEIYPSALPKTEKKLGRKPIYQNHLSSVLINFLLSQNGYTSTKTPLKWYKTLGMVNKNYNSLSYAEIKQENSRIKEHNIDTFYQICNKKLKATLLSTLNSLKKRNIIDYEEITYVRYKNKAYSKFTYIADEACLDSIEYAQQEALESMGVGNISELYQYNNFEEFNKIFNELLLDLYDISFVYKKLKISYISNNLPQVLTHQGIENERTTTNNLLRNYMDTSAENYQEKLNEAYLDNVLMFAPANYAQTQKSISKLLMEIQPRKESIFDWRFYINENREFIDLEIPDLQDNYNLVTKSISWIIPQGVSVPQLTSEEIREITPEDSAELTSLFQI